MKRPTTRLRQLRQQRKLTLGQLAMRVGVHRTYIHKIERGHRIPTVEVLARLAQYFECPIQDLIGLKFGERPKEESVVHG